MLKALIAGGIIFCVLLGWIAVQHLARSFAQRHPEWGPYRERGSCGAGECSCSGGGSCRNNEHKRIHHKEHEDHKEMDCAP